MTDYYACSTLWKVEISPSNSWSPEGTTYIRVFWMENTHVTVTSERSSPSQRRGTVWRRLEWWLMIGVSRRRVSGNLRWGRLCWSSDSLMRGWGSVWSIRYWGACRPSYTNWLESRCPRTTRKVGREAGWRAASLIGIVMRIVQWKL